MDIGLGELLLIFVVALIVFGPQRLPEIAAQLGRAVYELRRASADLTATLLDAADTPAAPPPPPPPPGQPCTACGAFVRAGYRFCTICGADQETWLRSADTHGESAPPAERGDHLTCLLLTLGDVPARAPSPLTPLAPTGGGSAAAPDTVPFAAPAHHPADQLDAPAAAASADDMVAVPTIDRPPSQNGLDKGLG